jgi:tRNA (guanine26-N2/guanine27-N2)-dimethyltransferase
VTINDRSSRAAGLARENAAALGLPIEVLEEDVNVLLSRRRFDAVDLDPFGTPAPFVDAAARSARRYLFVTATDTAPLCGAHMKAGMRRYFAKPMNTEYHGEVALRILLAFVAREVVKYDRGIEPLFCFSHEHFVRLHLAIADGAKAGDRTIGRIGFVLQCPSCFYREEQPGLVVRGGGRCPACGAVLSPVGPLWLGAVIDTPTLTGMEERLAAAELRSKQSIAKLLAVLRGELDTATHYDYHRIARSIGASPPPIDAVVSHLRAIGFRASRTHYSGTGIKTDAPVEGLMRAVGAGEDTSPTC